MSDSLKDISKLKVADLKRELKVRGLSTVGNKQELQDRLQVALQDGTDSALLLDDTGTEENEDILNEDDVLADEDDSNTNPPTDVGSSPLKRHLDEDLDEDTVTSTPAVKGNALQNTGPPAKKITLNRKVLPQETPLASSEKAEVEKKSEDADAEKKVVKMSEIGMKERLALRAVKFGEPVSSDAKKVARSARFEEETKTPADDKKAARAARFGVSASSVTSKSNVPEVNVDLLKKRAERFGIQPGSKVDLVEMEEKKKKRLERFGGAAPSTTNGSSKVVTSKPDVAPPTASKPGRIPITAPSAAPSKGGIDDKKKLRAERFKSSTVVSAK